MKWLRQLFCGHREKTLVVLQSVTVAETTADKCARCGKLSNKRTEL